MTYRVADAIAYLDEAGEKGFIRNLTSDCDDRIALLCALVFPVSRLLEFYADLKPAYDRFITALSPDRKVHITDAFTGNDPALASTAYSVRNDIFTVIESKTVPIVYDARRLGIARRSAERLADDIEAARNTRTSGIKLNERVSADRLEEECMIGVALKLDALAELTRDLPSPITTIDLATDAMDAPIAQALREQIERTRAISESEYQVKAFDPILQQRVVGRIKIEASASFELDTTHLSELVVVGKGDPLVFAADVVANSLYRHLITLPPVAPLNSPSSVVRWDLGQRVYGVRENAWEDAF